MTEHFSARALRQFDNPTPPADPSSATGTSGTGTVAGLGSCGEVVYPVPAQYVGNDAHNWHDSGRHWSSWHSGTDFGAPCGTPV
jgi:hypothetical protein